jgi:hypothetical protein
MSNFPNDPSKASGASASGDVASSRANNQVVPEGKLDRSQAVMCPVLGSMIAQGRVPLDGEGQLKLSDLHRFLVETMNVSEPLAGLTMGLGTLGNSLRDVLSNVLGRHFNPLELRGGLAQHPGDSAILSSGQFDEQSFDALVSHSKDAVRQPDGKIVDGTLTVTDLAEAILANVRRDGTRSAYTKGLPTALFEFGALINIIGKRDAATGRRTLSVRTLRDLYQHKRLPPDEEMKARPPSTVAELSETMAQMASSMPRSVPAEAAHSALQQAFHQVTETIGSVIGVSARSDTAGQAGQTNKTIKVRNTVVSGRERSKVDDSGSNTRVNVIKQAGFVAPQTIEQVVDDLDDVVDDALRKASRVGYFASLYKSVTESIRRAIIAQAFEDNARMERLDVIFASRFLEAWDAYQRGNKVTASYQVAFDALTDPKLLVVQHQLLALNAHVFLDLGIAAATVSPGAQLPSLRNDFLTINTILKRFVRLVEVKIGQVSPLIDKVVDVGMSFEASIINFSLDEARDAAWNFAQTLAAAPKNDWEALITQQDGATAKLGGLIRNPGLPAQVVLDLIWSQESKDIPLNIRIVGE